MQHFVSRAFLAALHSSATVHSCGTRVRLNPRPTPPSRIWLDSCWTGSQRGIVLTLLQLVNYELVDTLPPCPCTSSSSDPTPSSAGDSETQEHLVIDCATKSARTLPERQHPFNLTERCHRSLHRGADASVCAALEGLRHNAPVPPGLPA
jgi:hypothetical protein